MSIQTIPERVHQFSRSLFPETSAVVVAVSGGSDSVALLFLLWELHTKLSIERMVVAHCNHGLRGADSDADEELVKAYAEKLHLPFFSRRLEGHRLDEAGLEEWARGERYRFFNDVKNETECRYIATGHTMDDQAETVLMRLIRGSGLNGLRGIAPLRDDGVVRPLLLVRKTELEAWLTEKKIDFRHDRSNSDTHFFRNRLRHTILPELEISHNGTIRHLAALASEAQTLWSSQEPEIKKWLREHLIGSSEDRFRIKKNGMHHIVALEGIRQAFMQWGITPDRFHITAVHEFATRSSGTLLLPDGWRCGIGKEVLYFDRVSPDIHAIITVPGEFKCLIKQQQLTLFTNVEPPENLDRGKTTVYIDGAEMGTGCVYRTVTSRDRFIPFGSDREVSIVHFLKKQGFSRVDREYTAALFTKNNKTVWIPGIRLDERFRITANTKKVIKVQSKSFSEIYNVF
jgi:tRNA(Ile)-lysidine synthase